MDKFKTFDEAFEALKNIPAREITCEIRGQVYKVNDQGHVWLRKDQFVGTRPLYHQTNAEFSAHVDRILAARPDVNPVHELAAEMATLIWAMAYEGGWTSERERRAAEIIKVIDAVDLDEEPEPRRPLCPNCNGDDLAVDMAIATWTAVCRDCGTCLTEKG